MTWVLHTFHDVFREEPGLARGIEHHSHTPPEAIIRGQWRPVPYHLYKPIQQALRKMHKQEIIVPSRSPWRSPLVTVPKPDGALCLCIDFKGVNTITTFDAFPIPHVDECLEKIGQA